MSFLGGIFGGSGDTATTTSKTESTTQTNTGSGLAASGVQGSVNFISNDPGTALAALESNAYTTARSLDTVDTAVKANSDLSQNALSGALKAVGDTVTSANGLLSKTQQLYYEKIADNAGVAPQTLQQQQQAASADLLKLAVFGGLALGAIILLTRTSK